MHIQAQTFNASIAFKLQFFSTGYTHFPKCASFFYFTHKSKNCTNKMKNVSHLLQKEALHSKDYKHISKANFFPFPFFWIYHYTFIHNLKLFFHEPLCTYMYKIERSRQRGVENSLYKQKQDWNQTFNLLYFFVVSICDCEYSITELAVTQCIVEVQ